MIEDVINGWMWGVGYAFSALIPGPETSRDCVSFYAPGLAHAQRTSDRIEKSKDPVLKAPALLPLPH